MAIFCSLRAALPIASPKTPPLSRCPACVAGSLGRTIRDGRSLWAPLEDLHVQEASVSLPQSP